ncbi:MULTISPECIES: signal peptidase I [Comamonas]|uniref:signal peptidase I n=1 Tax=Comamonas TaxID=283 RepID=UPI00050E6E2F|nr:MULTISPECIES: signal peptidase I [Comamonas]KGG86347.1 signal peptidase [Comamonas thiooxydans]KGG97976.1 signal peptidase [Comamonas thiooxydans]KGH06606.1 signal peptidase [Comamonas thiooxydans]KGH08994.1 signal peptidase [Comamonas thiooxydans]TZG12548.1 signal peptidase I [Comamonas thiooxydans]
MQVMQWITAAILAAFVGYIAAWYTGSIDGNFALLLFLATVVTGVYWLAERFYFWPRRRAAATALEQAAVERRAELDRMGIAKTDIEVSEDAKGRILMQPWWLDWTAGLFPVIAIVFVLRSFLFEPFKIPSGSMIPTLMVGDLILVNKFTYGIRLPVINKKITEGNKPQRGDVMVFRYPPQPTLDYIKRVVGVPGDEVAYINKRLSINGKELPTRELPDFLDRDVMRYFKQFEETLGEQPHRSIVNNDVPAFIQGASNFEYKENCRYSVEGVTCKVPEGYYFMMGDNRDNSLDSRYWGFVPDQNIVGKAFFVWMNFGDLSRIGRFH